MSIHSCVNACDIDDNIHYLIKTWNEDGKWPATNSEVTELRLAEAAKWTMLAHKVMMAPASPPCTEDHEGAWWCRNCGEVL